jgi:hypothetical protein
LEDGWPDSEPIDVEDLPVRDPFIVVDPVRGYSYMAVTGDGFPMYRSSDLKTWYGPKRTFERPPGYWGTHRSWAPEIHRWKRRWYLFGTFADAANPDLTTSSVVGTDILVADAIDGPYLPLTDGPITPPDTFAIDGTLFIDDDGNPWIVYVKEWIDPRLMRIGRMAAIRLSPDLRSRMGDEVLLFAATDASWGVPFPWGLLFGYVTDGPWLHRTHEGELLMLWSGVGANLAYTTGVAWSTSGWVTGPWVQQETPFFSADGGHAMLFETFDGELHVALHAPNRIAERLFIAPVAEENATPVIVR